MMSISRRERQEVLYFSVSCFRRIQEMQKMVSALGAECFVVFRWDMDANFPSLVPVFV